MLSCRQIACGGLGARFPAWRGTSSALLSARTSRHTQMCRRPHHAARLRVSALSVDQLQPPFAAFNTIIIVPWLAMIFAPRNELTQAAIKSFWSMAIPSLIFVAFFIAASVLEADNVAELLDKVRFLFLEAVADPKKMAQLNSGQAYAAQDWAHLLCLDFICGRFIYLDGLARNIPTWHSLWLTFAGGPIGILSHFFTTAATGKQPGFVEPAAPAEKVSASREEAATTTSE